MIYHTLIVQFQNLKLNEKLKQLIILAICLSIPSQALAHLQLANMPLGDFKVRILKRQQKHIHTAALLCLLYEDGASETNIKQAWRENIEVPISANDQFLVNSIMRGMCPKIKPQKVLLK